MRRLMIELTDRRRRRLRRTAYVVAPVVLATLAIVHPGAAVSQVDLNDGAVWLTNTSMVRLARYNPAVDELNSGLVAQGSRFDVLQDGMDVLLHESNRIAVVDPSSVALGAMADIPYGADVSMAGGTTAVTRPTDGAVFAAPTQGIGALQLASGEPDLELGKGGAAVVARSGLVLGVEPDGTVHSLDVGAGGSQDSSGGHLHGTLGGDIEQITAVGDDVVVLAAGRLHTTHGDVDLTGFGGKLALQQPGPRADTVLVSSATALLEVPLDGGTPREIVSGGNGTPSAPVLVAGCAHAAWASPVNGYLVSCPGSDPQIVDLQGIASSDNLVFRVNRDVVVLNDALSGRVWLPMQDPEAREPNWEDIEEAPTDAEDDQAQDPEVSAQDLQAECATQPAPPSATDDAYGARPGSTTVLTVIANDASSNCGILVISEFSAIDEAFGTLELVDGGRALQLRMAATATGTAEFSYTVTDGRGDTAPDTATVVVTAVPDGSNRAPEQLRTGAMVTELGGAASYDVLSDFADPDGDQLVLLDAVAQGGGTARARGDGRVRFQSDNTTLGRQTILLTVSDGVEEFTGQMYVDIRPTGSVAPVMDAVHVVAYVDEVVTVRPLDAVRTESRGSARLAGVEDVTGLTIAADTAGGTFTVMSRTAGTYYVPFTVAASPQQATGLARVDVLERPQEVTDPVPVLDLALLPPGGEVTIDPLANDTDAGGGVLVLQSVDVPAGSGLRVAILDHHLLRFTATRTLEGPVVVGYRVSNGAAAAVGTVQVQPVPAAADQQAPVVPDVEVEVRTGGVVTIPVLANAFDPDGDELTLRRELPDAPTGAQGLMFVSGDVLRYQAPDVPTEVAVTFTVADPMGNESSAVVTVKVHASDAETKTPTQPEPLTARVYAGESVQIPVPLTGIDADGDGVLLLGPAQTPSMGIVTVGAADQLVYEAFPGASGTDAFTYAVEDWTGRRAVATVRVGVVARPSSAAEVISRDDEVAVRPGQTIDVPVLSNDVDTGGGDLTLDDLPVIEGVDAEVDGSRITVRTTEPGLLQIMYTARNDRGGQDTAMLTVTVSDDAPILPPIARDVVVPATDTLNATSIDVDVLAVAENPSGPMGDLQVEVDASAADVATLTPSGTVNVVLVDHAQTLPFLVRNVDPAAEGISSYAFIVVPALGDFPPLLRPGAADLAVMSGEPLEIDLEELVQVAPGRHAIVDDVSTVQTTNADGSTPVVDEGTLRFTSKEGYAGPASISALVSDGPLDEPTTHSRTLTFPITVLGAEQDPPTFTPSVLDVAPGDTARVDLAVFTSAPVETVDDAGQYEFRLTGAVPGFTVHLEDSVLSVTPDDDMPRGTVAGIPLAIDYGGDEPVVAQVDVRVVASSRPLARLLTFEVPDGVEGQASTVSALEGAFNPFPDTPLVLLDAVVETPSSGSARVSGSQVTVEPDAGFIGQMVTRYSARDATGDPDRVVEGRIVLTVRGAPEAPTTPRVTDPGDGVVRVSWEAPVNNGEPIDSYRVTAVAGGAVVKECSETSCLVDGLTNDVTYRFTVAAHNAVGWSAESAVSGDGRPDVLPERPNAPTVTRHDGWLHVEWSPPINRGSPITGYDVRITPASPDGGVLSTRGAVTSMDLRGLANGTDYRVSVCAKNNSGASEWQCSDETIGRPARRPEPPATVGANWGLFNGTLTVTWQEPTNDGGEPVTGYVIRGTGPGDVTVGADVRQYGFQARVGQQYTITVAAVNVEGESDRRSTQGHVYEVPGPVTELAADVDESAVAWDNGRVHLTWQAPEETGGVQLDHYVISDGNRQFTTSGTSFDVTGLRGGGWTLTVTAVNRDNAAGSAASVAAAVVTVPQQLLANPATSTATAGVVTFDWTGLVGGDGGSAVTGYAYRLERQGEAETSATQLGTTLTVPVTSENQWMRLTVWVVNAAGSSTPRDVQAWGVMAPAPQPTLRSSIIRLLSMARRVL